MKLIGPDFYNISDLLTEEELFIQKTAHDFVSNEFKPIINEHFEKGTFPLEIATKLGELGFMGSALPEASGGAGVSNGGDAIVSLSGSDKRGVHAHIGGDAREKQMRNILTAQC